MTFAQNFLALLVLVGLFILAYLYITKKTLLEFIKEIVSIMKISGDE